MTAQVNWSGKRGFVPAPKAFAAWDELKHGSENTFGQAAQVPDARTGQRRPTATIGITRPSQPPISPLEGEMSRKRQRGVKGVSPKSRKLRICREGSPLSAPVGASPPQGGRLWADSSSKVERRNAVASAVGLEWPQADSIRSMFCTAAPDAPLPRLSS